MFHYNEESNLWAKLFTIWGCAKVLQIAGCELWVNPHDLDTLHEIFATKTHINQMTNWVTIA